MPNSQGELRVAGPNKRNAQLRPGDCNTARNSGDDDGPCFPMTGAELRAQLRAQHTRNGDATEVTATSDESRCRRWQIRFPNLRPVEIWYTPEATRAEALAACDGATEALPIRDSRKGRATVAEADELRTLIAAILTDAPEREHCEAVASALADPINALRCYRLLAADA